ncbi:MAG: hypothetical protein L6R36_008776 [Xanthoria steineri]|nr:MAG: hypothetical protein L6R36_008776 [Xanthoria steineri]
MPGHHPFYASSLPDLKDKVNACTQTAICGRSYILVTELKRWLRSPIKCPSGKNTNQVGRLLVATYGNQVVPSSTLKLWETDSCCLLVFCILLLIDKGDLIEVFQTFNILDQHLPIPLHQLREKLKPSHEVQDYWKVAAAFDQKQWAFCPAKFELHRAREYTEHSILPICRKEKINEKGGTAKLWWIDVKEEFVGNALKQAVAFSRYNYSVSETDPDWRYQFALKSFEDSSRTTFENEKRAFDALRDHKGMVQFLAAYTHAEKEGVDAGAQSAPSGTQQGHIPKNTHNLLLEFGEFDLEVFFGERLPPVLQDETDQFWKALFEVADALDGLHNPRVETYGHIQELHGWHADIKPDNILSVQGKFKLSDPGFATFKTKSEQDPEEFLLGGTETYGAPERHPGRIDTMSAVSQTIDIWSLGCVFSIAATWVVFGYPGLQQFRKVRENAINQIVSRAFQSPHPQRTTSISAGDYFHDGHQVLKAVLDWHKVLRSALRNTDTVTSRLLDLVDGKMLLGSAHMRIKAKDLYSELKDIIVRSETGGRIEMPGNIMEALLQADKDAVSSVPFGTTSKSSEVPTGLDDRKARKSRLLGKPLMKTAHRSEGLKSVLASNHSQPAGRNHPTTKIAVQTGPSDQTRHGSSGGVLGHNRPSNAQMNAQISSLDRTPTVPESSQRTFPTPQVKQHTRSPKTHTPQDIFQAQEEIKARKTREPRDKLKLWAKEHKDKLLSQHYGNRDLMFLVDNGESMKRYWAHATALLLTLVGKSAGQDEDGLDLKFTLGQVKLENMKSKLSIWEDKMKEAKPMKEARTNMKTPLHGILSRYLAHVKQHKRLQPTKTYRKLTLLILTDGIWAGMGKNQNAVNDIIVKFVRDLEAVVGNLVDRPVSIEFVQFGDDPAATYRLRRLDTDMKWHGIP